MIRFVHLFNYACDIAQGEQWYLETHVPAARALPGVIGFRSWRGFDAGIPYPSPGAPTPHDQFVRRSELQFEDAAAAVAALRAQPGIWSLAAGSEPGFREFECMLLPEAPQYDLLRDAPPQHYKYMTLPLWWPSGAPEVDDSAEIFIDSYCIAYRPDLTFATGEDWYIGHHTREGKQLPGMKHYRTWRTIPVAENLPAPLDLNKWTRLTELGMSPDAYRATMVHDATRIRFTPSPFGSVIGRWLNIDIKPGDGDDLLA
ncbi:MAG TPA: hypothetical protein PKK39_00640 [Tepidiformaceae bacterium]|nr:hypothetical protein [Tepidiformaceae bacterium]